jgi:chromosome segregation ATPase
MATSSGAKPTTEERLNAMDQALEKLKQMLNYQLDFLQNLDEEAGRRMEQLEGDLNTLKFRITEELGKLHKELKSPKEEFEERIAQLEDKMAKLNSDWNQQPEK